MRPPHNSSQNNEIRNDTDNEAVDTDKESDDTDNEADGLYSTGLDRLCEIGGHCPDYITGTSKDMIYVLFSEDTTHRGRYESRHPLSRRYSWQRNNINIEHINININNITTTTNNNNITTTNNNNITTRYNNNKDITNTNNKNVRPLDIETLTRNGLSQNRFTMENTVSRASCEVSHTSCEVSTCLTASSSSSVQSWSSYIDFRNASTRDKYKRNVAMLPTELERRRKLLNVEPDFGHDK